MISVTKKYFSFTQKPVLRAGFLFSCGALTAVCTATTTGCTLYSNSDRENFNAKAVVQNHAAASSCRVQFAKPLSQDLLTLECFSNESAQTIVRVSR